MNSEIVGLPGRDWDGLPTLRPDPWRVQPAAAVLRRWRLVVTVAILGSLLALLICRLLTPLYTSTVSILIDPRERQRAVMSSDPMSAVPTTEEAVRKNEIAIIRSRNLAQAVIARLHLDQYAEFNPPQTGSSMVAALTNHLYAVEAWFRSQLGFAPDAPQAVPAMPAQTRQDLIADRFLERLVVTATDASRVIEIRFRSDNPERAAEIANAVADEYIRDKQDLETTTANATSQALLPRVAALNATIRDAERQIEHMRSDRGGLPAADLTALNQQLTDQIRQLVVVAGERAAAEARLANAETARTASNVSAFASVLGSPLIQRLEAEAAEASAKVDGLTARFSKSYPAVVQARSELQGLRARIRDQVEKIVASLRNDVATAQARQTELRRLLDQTKSEVARASQADVEIRSAERDLGANRALLTQLVTRLAETQAQVNREEPNARVISTGTVPRFPSFPPTLAVIAVAFVVSATGGALLAMLLERRDYSVRTAGQLRHLSTHRVLGAVPALRWAWRGRVAPAAGVLADSRSAYAENLRAVWLKIDRPRGQRTRTLLVTSALAGEGKTSMSISLARLVAASGRSAIIVDADLRNPSVHRVLGLLRSPGLAEVLEGGQALENVIQQDLESGTSVLVAGTTSRSPADLLQMDRMAEVLAELAARYDVVIIDTPPVLAVPDAGILARQVDMTALAVRWGATKAGTVATALQWLEDFNPQVGVVLTMVDWKKYANYDSPDGEMLPPPARA